MTKSIFSGLSRTEKRILELSSKKRFKNSVGISALDLESDLKLKNKKVMAIMEGLVEKGLGSINKNVKLYQIALSFDSKKVKKCGSLEQKHKEVITHIFFPSENILKHYYYKSSLVKNNQSEYVKRLALGISQIELFYFTESVLTKYYDHPENYKVDDSQSGGLITIKSETSDDIYINARFGKRKTEQGKIIIAVICSDLAAMSDREQSHWKSYEISNRCFTKTDLDFNKFIDRNFYGCWNDFSDPIREIEKVLKRYNDFFGKEAFFVRTKNANLHPPSESTDKDFFNSFSELFKLVGSDNINSEKLKEVMKNYLGFSEDEFVHKISGRALSNLQLFELFTIKVTEENDLYEIIKIIKKFRIESDHKILQENKKRKNATNFFYENCLSYVSKMTSQLEKLSKIIRT